LFFNNEEKKMKRYVDVSRILLWLSLLFATLACAENSVMDVQLPFYDGEAYICTQNSHSTPTHNDSATAFDVDFGLPKESIVVAATDGIMHQEQSIKSGIFTGFGRYAKVDAGNGYYTLYGHLSEYIASEGEKVFAGQPIAYSGNTGLSIGSNGSDGYHLHFGVHDGPRSGASHAMNVYGLDKNTNSLRYFSTDIPSEFVCGLSPSGDKYESRPIGKVFSDFSCKTLADNQGVLCWRNNPTTCQDGDDHVRYYKDNEGAFQTQSGSDVWTWCSKDTGQSRNLLSYLTGGFGVGGVGPGTSTEATDPASPNLPDYIVNKV
jgi:hypothetical protein